jgi:hypothetical protein
MAELRDYTSLRVGGPAQKFVEVGTESQIIAAIEAAGDAPILIMGGGTNLLIADSGFAGVVIRITNHSLQAEIDACSGATLTIGAGEDWDEFVATTIDRGFAGLETLSGIPGTVGAAPIQNIGAYGHEVAEFIPVCAHMTARRRRSRHLLTKNANLNIAIRTLNPTLGAMWFWMCNLTYVKVNSLPLLLTLNLLPSWEFQLARRQALPPLVKQSLNYVGRKVCCSTLMIRIRGQQDLSSPIQLFLQR